MDGGIVAVSVCAWDDELLDSSIIPSYRGYRFPAGFIATAFGSIFAHSELSG
jgi:hypothetical protein